MFLACPHCGYLVALIVAKDGPTRTCPRCHGALPSEAAQAVGDATVSTPPNTASTDNPPGATSTASAAVANTVGAIDAVANQSVDSAPATNANAARTPTQNETVKAAAASSELRKAGTVAPPLRMSESIAGEPTLSEPKAGQAHRNEPAHHTTPAVIEIDDVEEAATVASDTALTSDALQTDDTEPAARSASEVSESASQSANASQPAPLPPLSAATPAVAAPKRRTPTRNGKSETAVSSGRRAPSFARQQARARAAAPRLHWSGPALAIALALVLVLQLLLAQREELAADARWRPLVASLCGVLPCEIPPWREPAALTMLNRNVLPVADRTGVLRVSAGFRNDAQWAQPWPKLVLSLEDVDGRRVGQRAFSPKDYRKGYRAGELIAPGQSAAVQFDILEPAPHVVAFTFDFR